MPKTSDLVAEFDAAIAQVRRSLATGAATIEGDSARNRLAKLEGDLVTQRRRASETGTLDTAWFGQTVRWVNEWVPDGDISLIAALGRIARAAGGRV